MSYIFKYEVWPQSAPGTLCIVVDFIDGDFHTKKRVTKLYKLRAFHFSVG